MNSRQRVWAVVLNWKQAPLTKRCVRSILQNALNVEKVIVIDNSNQQEDSNELFSDLRDTDKVWVKKSPSNLGYAGGMQWGLSLALSGGADLVWLLNNDCLICTGSLEPLLEEMEENPKVGACSGVIERTTDPQTRFSGGARLDLIRGRIVQALSDSRPREKYTVEYMAGDAWLVRTAVVREVGGLDCRLFLYGEESDWCFRARRAGWTVSVVPESEIRAEGSASTQNLVCEVLFYTLRNTMWLVRRQAPVSKLILHHLLFFSYRFPRLLAGLIWRRQGRCLPLLTRSILVGLFGSKRWLDEPREAEKNRLGSLD